MRSDDDAEREAIVTEIARGKSVREVSRQFERSEAEIRSIVADAVTRAYDGEHLRQEWALEDHRLKMVCLAFFSRALEGDTASAAIFLKASERRASLAGANAPQSHAVHLSHNAVPAQKTSTEEYLDLLDTIQHISPRERALENRRQDGDASPEVTAEINALRIERGALTLEEEAAHAEAKRALIASRQS